MADMSREEVAAIRAAFANPAAVDDAHSEMVGQMPPMPHATRNIPVTMSPEDVSMMPNAEDHTVVPQDGGVGVPQAKMFGGEQRQVDYRAMMEADERRMQNGQNCSVYEDNGQKFMIRNGCIFKQTWTTIENGAECRMFDVRKGKKVSPRGIVIQKYDWVPLSVAGAIESAMPRRRPRVQRPVEKTEVKSQPPPDANENHVVEKPVEVKTQVEKPVEKKEFKPLSKPVAKPSPNKVSGPNAGTLKKPTK